MFKRLKATDALILAGLILLLFEAVHLIYGATKVSEIGCLAVLLLLAGLMPRVWPAFLRLRDEMEGAARRHERVAKGTRIAILLCAFAALVASPVTFMTLKNSGMARAWGLLGGGWALGEIGLCRCKANRGALIAARVALYAYLILIGAILAFAFLISLCGP